MSEYGEFSIQAPKRYIDDCGPLPATLGGGRRRQPAASEQDRRELRRLASEARHEALRLLREMYPLTYQELHKTALAKRGLGREKGGK
jgi:hypothetical protein